MLQITPKLSRLEQPFYYADGSYALETWPDHEIRSWSKKLDWTWDYCIGSGVLARKD